MIWLRQCSDKDQGKNYKNARNNKMSQRYNMLQEDYRSQIKSIARIPREKWLVETDL